MLRTHEASVDFAVSSELEETDRGSERLSHSPDPDLSVVVPVYYSEQSLRSLHERTAATLNARGISWEMVLVDDGSQDGSWDILQELARDHEEVLAVQLTRNFGQHNALMCGFGEARGAWIVTIDDDLQIPPEEIGKLLDALGEDVDLVYGTYESKRHSLFRNFASNVVQKVFQLTFGIQGQFTSFRAIRRTIVDEMLSYQKSFTFIDGLLAWYTQRVARVTVEHREREFGSSRQSLGKLFVLALNMVTNFSLLPLQAASLGGVLVSLLGFAMGLYFFVKKLALGIPVTGFATLIVAVTMFSGIQLLTIGVLGEYLGRIHINVNRRPQFAVRQRRGGTRPAMEPLGAPGAAEASARSEEAHTSPVT